MQLKVAGIEVAARETLAIDERQPLAEGLVADLGRAKLLLVRRPLPRRFCCRLLRRSKQTAAITSHGPQQRQTCRRAGIAATQQSTHLGGYPLGILAALLPLCLMFLLVEP